MSGITGKDGIRNEYIRDRINVASIVDKMSKLDRLFGYIVKRGIGTNQLPW